MVGDGGRIGCALHGYGCGSGSELRSVCGSPGAPYGALRKRADRDGFAEGFQELGVCTREIRGGRPLLASTQRIAAKPRRLRARSEACALCRVEREGPALVVRTLSVAREGRRLTRLVLLLVTSVDALVREARKERGGAGAKTHPASRYALLVSGGEIEQSVGIFVAHDGARRSERRCISA